MKPCNIYHTRTFIHKKDKNHKPYGNGVDKNIWMNLANNKNFIASTQSKKHRTRIILTMKMGQKFNVFKTKPQGFFVLVIFTLHQAWPLYSLSIPYICFQIPIGSQMRCWNRIKGTKAPYAKLLRSLTNPLGQWMSILTMNLMIHNAHVNCHVHVSFWQLVGHH